MPNCPYCGTPISLERLVCRLALTQAMRIALQYLERARDEGDKPHGIAANILDSPYIADGQVWMDWRTAAALKRRGLVRVEDETDVYLV